MQTILLVDDDTAIGNLEQEVRERAGYAVRRAYSGTEALLLLQGVLFAACGGLHLRRPYAGHGVPRRSPSA